MDLIEKNKVNPNRHPWELSRAKCIFNIIKQYSIRAIADIGAGDRFFLEKYYHRFHAQCYAVDSNYKKFFEIINNIKCYNNIDGFPKLNTTGSVVLLMDVLEHINDDSVFLKKTLEKIPDDGVAFITVPSFQFLFSEHDVFLKHQRRYTRKRLCTIALSCDCHIESCFYFYFSLFFIRLLSILSIKRKKERNSGIGYWNFNENHIITRIIYVILNIDFSICHFLSRFHIYLPGLSLLMICKKGAT
ncbi:MAG: class I SAM-dependent methyltransferase [Treponema sp.]|nr:class I SAM-dependent methyltransferase [Treponema sp.]